MALMRWDPWQDLLSFRGDLAPLWLTPPWLADAFGARENPPLNVSVNDEDIVAQLELPGTKSEDVDISLTGDVLVVKGEKKTEGEGKYQRRERFSGSFSRTIHVPERVGRDAIKAQLTNGVLTITLPKAEEARARKISVKASG